MNTYPGIITSRRTRRNLRHFRLLPINPPTESAVQFRAARALNQLSSHASLLVGKWRHCRNSTNYQHHIWRPEKISNSVPLFAVRPIMKRSFRVLLRFCDLLRVPRPNILRVLESTGRVKELEFPNNPSTANLQDIVLTAFSQHLNRRQASR